MTTTPEPTALSAITTAEIDQQIATARRFPRDIKRCAQALIDMATIDEETAEACWYRLERTDKKTGEIKHIDGKSIRLAEMAAQTWGNIRAAARIIEISERFVTTQGVAHDLESNAYASVEIKRSIWGKYGRYSEDMIGMTCNAACSVAYRNAVFKIVPEALTERAYRAAKSMALGSADDLPERRQKMMAAFAKFGAKREQVLAKLQVASVDDITLDHLERMLGIYNAIKGGDQTVAQAFDLVDASGPEISKPLQMEASDT